jgi:methionyl-tRNA formyltransferase
VGGFNLHPGPLPDYAGMNAPAWAIYNGEPRHGVTLHWMTSKIDDGYIAYQEIFDLTPGDTGLSVSMRCITLGLGLIGRLLADLALPGGPPRVPQDHSRRRYFSRQIPHGGRVPAGMTAQALHRFVRASDFAPFPSPWGTPLVPYNGEDLGLLRISLTGARHDTDEGTIRRQDNGQWWFAAADEWVALERVLRLGRSGDAAALLS